MGRSAWAIFWLPVSLLREAAWLGLLKGGGELPRPRRARLRLFPAVLVAALLATVSAVAACLLYMLVRGLGY